MLAVLLGLLTLLELCAILTVLATNVTIHGKIIGSHICSKKTSASSLAQNRTQMHNLSISGATNLLHKGLWPTLFLILQTKDQPFVTELHMDSISVNKSDKFFLEMSSSYFTN